MRNVEVHAIMCDNDSCGFTTGIGTESKIYTEDEFMVKKYNELIKGIKLIKGCHWSWSFNWSKN